MGPTEQNQTDDTVDRELLLAEYHSLNRDVHQRLSRVLIVHSILVTGSFLIVIFAIANIDKLAKPFFGFSFFGFITLGAAILVIFGVFWERTSKMVNCLCFDRINEIESVLGMEGHRAVHKALEERYKMRYWLRRQAWTILFY